MTQYFIYIKIVDSYSDLENYKTPLGTTIGSTLEMTLHQHLHVRKTVAIDLMQIRTLDGFLTRSYSEIKQPVYKEFVNSSKMRRDGESYGVVSFSLTGRTQLFERIYPNFIEFVSDCGGVIEVIFFTFSAFGFFHHLVFMDKQLINKAILSGNKQDSPEA